MTKIWVNSLNTWALIYTLLVSMFEIVNLDHFNCFVFFFLSAMTKLCLAVTLRTQNIFSLNVNNNNNNNNNKKTPQYQTGATKWQKQRQIRENFSQVSIVLSFIVVDGFFFNTEFDELRSCFSTTWMLDFRYTVCLCCCWWNVVGAEQQDSRYYSHHGHHHPQVKVDAVVVVYSSETRGCEPDVT